MCVNKLFGIAPTFRYRTWHFSLFGTAPTFRYRTWHFSVSRPLFGITRGTFRYRMWRFSVSHRDHILNAASPGGHAAVQFRHSVFRSRSGVKPSPVLVRRSRCWSGVAGDQPRRSRVGIKGPQHRAKARYKRATLFAIQGLGTRQGTCRAVSHKA